MSTPQQIGFIGTGAMGIEMVLRLLERGSSVVVSNRTRANAQSAESAGASWAPHPREVAQQSDIVLSCLLDSNAVEQVYLGSNGLIESARPGQVFAEHGTFSPILAAKVQRSFADIGAEFIDMPVTGGPDGARGGRLAAMAGGSEAAINAVAAVAQAYCSQVTRIGEPGSGLQLKLVNQLLVSIHMASAAEAVALLQHLDIDLRTASSVLQQGWAGSTMLSRAFAQLDKDSLRETGVKSMGMLEIQQLVAQLLPSEDDYSVFDSSRTLFERAVEIGVDADDPAALYLAVANHGPEKKA